MASDIPVFREIGGEYMAYFDLADSQNLADLVIDMESGGAFPAPLNLDNWRWLSWREASAQLVGRVQRNLHSDAKVPESQHAHCP